MSVAGSRSELLRKNRRELLRLGGGYGASPAEQEIRLAVSSPSPAPPWSTPRPPPFAAGATKAVLSFAPGQAIYAQGDPARALYAVVSGAVRTVRHSRDGRRQVGAFYFPGDRFGVAMDDEHGFSAEAMCLTQVLTIDPSTAREAAGQTALCELARAHDHLAMLGRRSAEEKVASFLIEMASHGASDLTTLPMSRQDIADYLGLALETVSRALSRFQDQGLVAFASTRDFHIIRSVALVRLAETWRPSMRRCPPDSLPSVAHLADSRTTSTARAPRPPT